MPGVAFPPVGPLGLSSPPSPVLCSAKTATLPLAGRFACRSLPDTLFASVRSCCPFRAYGLGEAPRPHQGFWSPGPPFRECDKETEGSPKFPSYPYGCMPRSQTPVVSCALASIAHRSVAFRCLQTVGVDLATAEAILLTTTLHISGRNNAACLLAHSSSVLPLLG